MKRKLLHVSMALAMVTFGVKSYPQAITTDLESQATANGEAILSELHKNAFVENKGQWNSQALAKIDLPSQSAWITADGWRMNFYSLQKAKQADVNSNRRAKSNYKEHTIHFTHLNANPSPQLVKQKAVNSDANVNYFNMDNYTMYQDVKAFEEVVMKDVYNGIDQRWYLDNNGKLRFDYMVQPNANPQQIKIKVDGAERVYIENNEVKIVTSVGLVTMGGLKSMQENRVIKSRWSVTKNNELVFTFENYNPNLPLIIDPYISINAVIEDPSSFDFFTNDMGVSASSEVYLVGYTYSPSFPTTPGVAYPIGDGFYFGDGVIAHFNASLTNLVDATYITGSLNDDIVGIKVGNNDIIIAGNTYSSFVNGGDNFGFGPIPLTGPLGAYDIYLMKLSLSLSSVTQLHFIGGSSIDQILNLNNDVIVGKSYSADFPIVGGSGSYQGVGDGIIIKFNPTTLNVTYTDIYGGNNDDELVGYVAEANFELLIGNSSSGSFTSHPTLTVGNPHYNPGISLDGFIIKLDMNANLDFLGGSEDDYIQTISYGDVITVSGGKEASLFIGGYTYSNDFSQITGGFQTTNNSSWDTEGFILQYKVSGDFIGSSIVVTPQVGTYWGVPFSLDEIKVVKLNGSNLFIAGVTQTSSLPYLSANTYNPFNFNNGIISKFNWQGTANISTTGIKNPPVYASLHSNIAENIHVINSNRVILGGNTSMTLYPVYDSIAYPTGSFLSSSNKMIATDFCLGYVYNPSFVTACPGYILEFPISNSQLFTSITWKDPSNNTLSTNDTLILDPYDGSPYYMLYLTDIVGCTSRSKLNVSINNINPPLNAYAVDSTLCPGQVLNLKTSSSVWNAIWYLPDGSVITNINPTITVNSEHAGNIVAKLNQSTCIKYDTVPVYVTPVPVFASNHEEACEGEDITLSVTTTGMSSYNWVGPNGATHTGASWSLNNVTSDQDGTYNVTVTDNEGCTNTAQMQVVVNPMPITTVVPNGSQLIAVQSGATYQWVNCTTNQNVPAPQGVQQTLIPDSINHQYKVIINLNGCVDTSACFVNMTGIDEEMLQTYGWIVYPNPNNGSFTVHLVENALFDLVDMNGKVIRSYNNLITGANNITENLPAGVYMLVNKSNFSVARIIIE